MKNGHHVWQKAGLFTRSVTVMPVRCVGHGREWRDIVALYSGLNFAQKGIKGQYSIVELSDALYNHVQYCN